MIRRTMIIACPACATRYVVPDSAIGIDGRTVRCAKCRTSWFQEGPPPPAAAPAPAPAPAAPPSQPPASEEAARPGFSDGAVAAGIGEPEPEPDDSYAEEPEPSYDEPPEPVAAEAVPPPPVQDIEPPIGDDYSQFEHEPPFRPRRNWLKLLTWAAVLFALLAAGTIVAVSYWGLPDWVPVSRPTFAQARPDLQLDFPADQQERRQLPNGTEFFGASGTITNIGGETRRVPPILIVLRDARERIVYSWEVTPPQRSLAPGESVTINEAVTDVPRSARFADIGWKPE